MVMVAGAAGVVEVCAGAGDAAPPDLPASNAPAVPAPAASAPITTHLSGPWLQDDPLFDDIAGAVPVFGSATY
jgi:hypothetical protein